MTFLMFALARSDRPIRFCLLLNRLTFPALQWIAWAGALSGPQTRVIGKLPHQVTTAPNHAPQETRIDSHLGLQRQWGSVHRRKESHVTAPRPERRSSRAGGVITPRLVCRIPAFPASGILVESPKEQAMRQLVEFAVQGKLGE